MVGEFLGDTIERELRLIDGHQSGWRKTGDLATQFGADRAARARHEDDLS